MIKKLLLLSISIFSTMALAQTLCVGGFAGSYPCNGYDLQSHISLSVFGSFGATDSWGWTDPMNGDEYAIVALEEGTVFIDISDPLNPVYLGNLTSHTDPSSWRDVKTYNNHAFIVSEASGHGMQVFDLTRLRNVTNPPVNFTEDAHYNGFGSAHNIVINEDTGYAYGVGTDTFGGGSHFVNIQDPLNPVAAGGYSNDGYTHDAQVIIYSGPDSAYTGREILISSGGGFEIVSIVDVTDKSNPVGISTMSYSNSGYTHQAWFTEDHRYLLLGDEFDESNVGFNTRTIVFDLLDLDNPQFSFDFFGTTTAIDHNGYVKGDRYYLANYSAGFREIDVSDIGNQNMSEMAFFDTYPPDNNASYDGAWNVYPFFGSGNILISDRSGGFFLVKSSESDTTDPVAVCQNAVISLDENGTAILDPSLVDGGSSDNSGFFTLSVTPNTFDCNQIGNVNVTLVVTDPSGNTDSCNSIITIVDDLGPDFTCPSNTNVGYDEGQGYYTLTDFVASGDVTATDNCTVNVVISQDPAPGTQLTEGVYTISFSGSDDEGNTGSCSFELNVMEILSTDDNFFDSNILLYPNPSDEFIHIESGNNNLQTFSLYNLLGQEILNYSFDNSTTEKIDISELASGMYLIRINNNTVKRLIVR
ncbi:MAG: choice-of-anchor B family protein [Bacteroidia bacterium]|nr:choice-of-anchor B family protein [Bacteroidia bacterium]NNM09568.1 choice-of-anchor B family protein [Flavobacteriaceae bacterium]